MDTLIAAIVTLIAAFVGLAGVALGWYLTQSTANRERKAADEKQERRESAARVLDAVESAEEVARQATGVAHGVNLKRTGATLNQEQFTEETKAYNLAVRKLELRIVRVKVLGPAWFVEPLTDFQKHAGTVMKALMDSQAGSYTEETSQELQRLVTRFTGNVDELIALANRQALLLKRVDPAMTVRPGR